MQHNGMECFAFDPVRMSSDTAFRPRADMGHVGRDMGFSP